jgi:hypothetical protein
MKLKNPSATPKGKGKSAKIGVLIGQFKKYWGYKKPA